VTVDQLVIEFFENHATVLYFYCDAEGFIKKTNKYTRQVLGEDLKGKRLSDIFVDFYNAFVLEDFLRGPHGHYLLNVSTASGLPQTFYFRFYRTEGGVVVFGEDDSEEMDNLRRSLLILNNELNNLTRELQKKNAELTRLNEIKNQFLGMAAHDLRTPIGAIKNYSEFLLEEAVNCLEEEHVSFLTTIRHLSDFMLQLLNDLLDLSAIESGLLQLKIGPVDIVPILRDSLQITSIFAAKKGIQVILEYPEEPILAMADPIRIKQVFDNLLTNAIKFTELGSRVSVEAYYVGDNVLVSVADEGPGVPPSEMDRLFRPFSTTSAKATAGEKGTGLGLAITKKIIDSHNGKIWVENRSPKGAVFVFTLPRAV
jgi:signal transduction histidine kinase